MSGLKSLPMEHLEALCTASIHDFCDGYRWMFEKEFKAAFVSAETRSESEFKAAQKGLVAVNNIAYAGEKSGSGKFQIFLGTKAIFILGGVTVMLPIMRIREDCQKGSKEDAEMLADAVGEVGNLLTGAFGKVFREGVPEFCGMNDPFTMHLRLPIYIGEKDIPEIDGAETVHVFTYEIALKELDSFQVSVVFPAA